ncbi:Phytocyanin domain, partial [Dillenia turbinata]
VDYTKWANSETFALGDTLLFSYGGTHGVDVVSQTDYTNCNAGNALQSYSDGNTIITLNSTGPVYFMCPTFGHCGQGMKLAVTVGASATPPGSNSPPPPPPATSSPTTPSTSTATASPPPPTHSKATRDYCDKCQVMLGLSLVLGTFLVFWC